MPTPLEILKERMMPSDADAMKCCSNEWCGRYHNEEFNSEITQLTIKLLESEIERLRSKKESTLLYAKNDKVTLYEDGYRKSIQENIDYLSAQLSEIKKI